MAFDVYSITLHPYDDLGPPLEVEVDVFRTYADLSDWVRRDYPDESPNDRVGFTEYAPDPFRITINLAGNALHTGVIVHEATHAALFALAHEEGAEASTVYYNHDERIAEYAGNLAARILHALPEQGFTLDPEDDAEPAELPT